MAAPPSSSSDATLSSNDSDTESSATNYGSIADEAAHVEYRDGQLSWSGESYTIRDEDVITITRAEHINTRHTIWSLVPTNPPSDSGLKQTPFELRTTSAANLPKDFLDKHLFQALPAHLDPTKSYMHVLISTLSGTGLAPA